MRDLFVSFLTGPGIKDRSARFTSAIAGGAGVARERVWRDSAGDRDAGNAPLATGLAASSGELRESQRSAHRLEPVSLERSRAARLRPLEKPSTVWRPKHVRRTRSNCHTASARPRPSRRSRLSVQRPKRKQTGGPADGTGRESRRGDPRNGNRRGTPVKLVRMAAYETGNLRRRRQDGGEAGRRRGRRVFLVGESNGSDGGARGRKACLDRSGASRCRSVALIPLARRPRGAIRTDRLRRSLSTWPRGGRDLAAAVSGGAVVCVPRTEP